MEKRDFELIRSLSDAFGPTGEEDEVREFLIREVRPFADRLYTDRMGNLVAEKGKDPEIVFTAHMDEIGFMITGFCPDGTLRFDEIGGVVPNSLPSKRVVIGKNRIPGVICAKPVHFTRKSDDYTPPAYEDLRIDIGATTEEEAKRLVSLGDGAVFDTKFGYLDARKETVKGKALDDRLGCYYLCKMLRDERIRNAAFAFLVQEETGLRGSFALAGTGRYRVGVAIDSTTASDMPGSAGVQSVCAQLKGGVISFADRATTYDHDLIMRVFDKLGREGIPAQTKSLAAGGNDASSLQKAGVGMKAIALSSPTRYIHAPVATMKVKDMEYMEKALCSIYELISGEAK